MLAHLLTLWLAVDGAEPGVMRGNLTAAFVLQPYLASPAKFRDPANAEIVTACLDQLALLQHQLTAPTPAAISTLFTEQVQRARADFTTGRADAARLRLRGVTAMCLGCHTRAPAESSTLHTRAEHLDLSAHERAQLLAATRQFDAALELWSQILERPAANGLEAYDQALALRAAVGVAVRAKDDPQRVLALLAAVRDREGLPGSARRAAAAWQKQATAWKAERFIATLEPAPALYARAKALIESTPALASLAPAEDSLVALQRASSYLNRALELQPKAAWRGEALYLLAVASSAALDPDLWQLDELYLEACVRENPHSRLAVRCVDRLADRTLYQYTLGGVTQVPLELGSRVGELRALAAPLLR